MLDQSFWLVSSLLILSYIFAFWLTSHFYVLGSDTFQFDAEHSISKSDVDAGDLSDDEDSALLEELAVIALDEDDDDDGHQDDLAVIDVVVPEGCAPGDLLTVETSAGVVQVVVPEGYSEGESFDVATPR